MLRKSLSTVYNINKFGLCETNKPKPKNYLYYTNFRKSLNIPQKKNDYQINHIKTNSINNHNPFHKVHLDRMINQLKNTINEMNNKSFGYNNLSNKNYIYGRYNNYQIRKITPLRNYQNLNEKTYSIINRTFHDLYQNSSNSFVEPVNKHPYEERNEIEYFKLKKRYSATPKRFTYQIENSLDDNPFSYRNLRKKYDDDKKDEYQMNESKSTTNIHINGLNNEKLNYRDDENNNYIPLRAKKILEYNVKEPNKFVNKKYININNGINHDKIKNTYKDNNNNILKDDSPIKININNINTNLNYPNYNKEKNILIDDDLNKLNNNNIEEDKNKILKERILSLENERNEINLKIQKIIEENKNLYKNNEKNLIDKQKTEETLNKAKYENEELLSKLNLKENENEELLNKLNLKENENKELLNKLNLKENENEELLNQLNIKENENKEILNKLNIKDNEMKEILKNVKIKEKENEEMKKNLIKNNEEFKTLHSRNIPQNQENKVYQDEINNLNLKIQQLKEDNDSLNDKLKESKINFDKIINEYKDNYSKLKQEKDNNLSNLIKEINSLKLDLNNEKIRNKQFETKLNEKENEIGILIKEKEIFKNQKIKDEELNNNLKNQIEVLKKQNEEINNSTIKLENSNNENLKKIKEKLENKIKENEEKIEQKDNELKELKKEMEEENLKYENEINENKIEIEKLKIEKDEVLKNFNNSQLQTNKIINLSQENLEQKNKIQTLENNISKLNEKYENKIKEKDEQIEQLKKLIIDLNNENSQIINNIKGDSNIFDNDYDTNDDLDFLSKLSTLKKKFLLLEIEINKKNKEINELKINNQQLIDENKKLNLNSKPIDSEREGIELTINNLKELIKEKEDEIIKLKNEKKLNELDNNLLDISSNSKISQGLTESEKIEKYKKKIEEYKERLKSAELQLQLLRNEIKDIRKENNSIKSFDGKINSFDDFLKSFNTAFQNYKPKKKEQEEAFKKIQLHLSGLSNNNI